MVKMNSWEDTGIIEIIEGRTKELKKDFNREMTGSGEMISTDDVVTKGSEINKKLNECLRKWKNFPKYRHLINVLCQCLYYDCKENRKLRLFEEQESGKPLSKSSEDILSDLTDRLTDRVDEIEDDDIRGELEKKYTRDMIRDNLLDLKEDFFLEFLAPVCDMDEFVVMMFMVRVFERDELSSYKTNEFLLKMAMMIHEQYELDSTIEILYRLKACHDSAVPDEVPEEVPEENGTYYIDEKSKFKLKDEREAFRTEDYPQIQKVMSWYKAAVKPLARNREKAYNELLEKVMELYSDKMDDFLRIVTREEITGVKRWNRENFKVPITIWYDNSHSTEPALIMGGTIFNGENGKYGISCPVELPPEDYVQMCVHVIPDPDNSKLPKQKAEFIPSETAFTILRGNVEKDGRPVIRNIRTATLSTVKEGTENTENNIENAKNIPPRIKLDSSRWTKPKWTREDYEESLYTGFVVMDVLAGKGIPEELYFEYKGFKFKPIITEDLKHSCDSEDRGPDGYVQALVHVIPDPDNSELSRAGKKTVPENTVFTILRGNEEENGKPVIRNIRTVSIEEVKEDKLANDSSKLKLNKSRWTKLRWTKEDYERKQIYNGFVVMDVMVGEPIPEDLCFEYKGFKFAPIIEKGVEGPCYSKKTVLADLNIDCVSKIKLEKGKVRTKGKAEPETKQFYVLEETEKITRMNPMPDVVRKISNSGNRVTVSEDQVEIFGGRLVVKTDPDGGRDILKAREMEDSTGQKLFSRYMYGEEDYLMVSGLDMAKAKETGLDLRNLSSDWLTDSKIPESSQQFAALSEYRQRSILMVLLFLEYIENEKESMETEREIFVRNFRRKTVSRMGEYRFDGLYTGYPLDCLLLVLLGVCVPEDICDILRVIYKENERQRKKDENKL